LTRSAVPGLAIATAVLIAGLLLAFTVGRYPVSLAELANVLFSKITAHRADVSPAVESVIMQVRGPRVLAAALVSAAQRLPALPSRPVPTLSRRHPRRFVGACAVIGISSRSALSRSSFVRPAAYCRRHVIGSAGARAIRFLLVLTASLWVRCLARASVS
jgi:hypothetical protein